MVRRALLARSHRTEKLGSSVSASVGRFDGRAVVPILFRLHLLPAAKDQPEHDARRFTLS